MKRLLPLALGLLLMGQDCEPAPAPTNFYCAGAVAMPDPDGLDGLIVSLLTGAQSLWDTIVGGQPSTDRRSTVYVGIVGKGSCSGTIIGPHTVLTAAHCAGTGGYHIYPDRNLPNYFVSTGELKHPDYYKFSSNGDLEARKSDLLLIYVKETLPLPYTTEIYDTSKVASCTGLIAQGWGQTESKDEPDYIPCPDNKTRCLRETPYTVYFENEKTINTKGIPGERQGFICFGDSGGPLYAVVDGELMLAGVTSTTASTDCVVASTHIKASYFRDWIAANLNGPGVP